MKKTIATAVVALAVGFGGGYLVGDRDGDGDKNLEGDELQKAAAAALAVPEAQGGRVREAEKADEDVLDHRYEVKVVLPTGEKITVELDQDFNLVAVDD